MEQELIEQSTKTERNKLELGEPGPSKQKTKPITHMGWTRIEPRCSSLDGSSLTRQHQWAQPDIAAALRSKAWSQRNFGLEVRSSSSSWVTR